MKKAVTLWPYSDTRPFTQPTGVVDVQLDKATNLLATPTCPDSYTSAFIVGTEPTNTCEQGTGARGFFSRIFGLGGDKALPPPAAEAKPAGAADPPGEDAKKKKGFFGRVAGIFKDDKSSNPPPPTPAGDSGNAPH
jgi:penicillin-binding protein 1B